MAGVSDKIKSLVGFLTAGFEGRNDDIFDELENEVAEYPVSGNYALEPRYQTNPVRKEQQESKVLNHPAMTKGYEVLVSEPRSYEDAANIVKHLKDKKTVVLNLHLLDKEQSIRIVDFLCGATHALAGNQQKIGDTVFIFTPNTVSLSSDSQRTRIIRDALWNQPQ